MTQADVIECWAYRLSMKRVKAKGIYLDWKSIKLRIILFSTQPYEQYRKQTLSKLPTIY